jgi:hypothetical protein
MPADARGGPPRLTLVDAIGLIGGGYRVAAALVEIDSERLAEQTRRVGRIVQRRQHLWRGARTSRRSMRTVDRPGGASRNLQ